MGTWRARKAPGKTADLNPQIIGKAFLDSQQQRVVSGPKGRSSTSNVPVRCWGPLERGKRIGERGKKGTVQRDRIRNEGSGNDVFQDR